MTDPSVIYAALLDGRYRGTIYASDLQADSPYNTYRYAGLPPGPICNPGMTSLKAAMKPRADRLPVLCGGERQSFGEVAVFGDVRAERQERSAQ